MLLYIKKLLGEYIKKNIVKYFFTIIIFLIGIVFGAMAVKVLSEQQTTELIGSLNILFEELAANGDKSSLSLFLSVAWLNIKLVLVIWLMGFTIIGIPVILFILFARGFVIGFTVGLLVNSYVLKGLLFALAAVLPHNFIAVPVFLIIGVAAMSFSLYLIKKRNAGNQKLLTSSLNYSVCCLMAGLAIIVSSFVEVYISPVFMRWLTLLF